VLIREIRVQRRAAELYTNFTNSHEFKTTHKPIVVSCFLPFGVNRFKGALCTKGQYTIRILLRQFAIQAFRVQDWKVMKRLCKEPLVHFLIVGALLFGLNAWRSSKRPKENAGTHIAVTAAVVERLRAGYERQFHQTPDETELRELITAHVREEVLCREALALGLDRDDTIVRRRLAQKMEFLTADLVGATEADEATLQKFFTENAAHYARPAQVTFRHVYFSTEKRKAGMEHAAREALAALENGASAETFGDGFLHGLEFAGREPDELAALFGPEFARQLAAQPVGRWRGPLQSSYGAHLVLVESRSEPRAVTLDEVRPKVLRDYDEQRRRSANQEVFERLKQRYQITVDESSITNAPAVRLAEMGK
jgi:hypothetical protein